MSQYIALCHWQRHCPSASNPIPTWDSSTPMLPFRDILSLLHVNRWMVLHPSTAHTHPWANSISRLQELKRHAPGRQLIEGWISSLNPELWIPCEGGKCELGAKENSCHVPQPAFQRGPCLFRALLEASKQPHYQRQYLIVFHLWSLVGAEGRLCSSPVEQSESHYFLQAAGQTVV